MSLKDKIINALGGEIKKTPQKTQNSFVRGNDFLRYGARNDTLYSDWSDIKLSNEDMYRGYSYAVIQKRANKVASLAKTNISTSANKEVASIYAEEGKELLHPYLKLIRNSRSFTEKQFWKNISIYLDLKGVYYLGVVRNMIEPENKDLPTILTDVKKFTLINPFEVTRVLDNQGNVAGYVERKPDGRERVWPTWQIIEIKELNPFDNDETWSLSDAAKESVYTINKSNDYTRQSLNGNLDAPGILTTDIILEDEDFRNFTERVRQHKKGEPIFGNGAGSISWQSMTTDLDRSALSEINEINRSALFAVSGTSKTALGIEQSGTTRDTSRVQTENFLSDTIQPRLEDIVDFLNLDYKQMYPREYKKTGYMMWVDSAISKDYDSIAALTSLKQQQFELAENIAMQGYTIESARQYALGEIEMSDLEEEISPAPEDDSEDDGDTPPEDTPQNPTNPQEGVTQEELEILEETSGPTTTEIKTLQEENLHEHHHDENCSCCEVPKKEVFENDLSEDEIKELNKAYRNFLATIKRLQKDIVQSSIDKVDINSFDEADILDEDTKESLTNRLKNAIRKYWWILVPLFGNNMVAQRNSEFGEDYKFKFTNDIKKIVSDNASRVSEGHLQTIIKDILTASNRAFAKIVENAAVEIILQGYKESPSRFSEYFDKEPTKAQIRKAIKTTDILSVNKKIYDRANKMAQDGYDRQSIVRAIRKEYDHISKERAELIARNETSRAFTHSQYDADYQFLNSIGQIQNAYKELYSRTGNPCPYCQAIIDLGPIPFTQNFMDKGETIDVVDNGQTKSFTANYEDIKAGVLHPNCNCAYRLIIRNGDLNSEDITNNGVGSSNINRWYDTHSNLRTSEILTKSNRR